jgi:hypothetical protein
MEDGGLRRQLCQFRFSTFNLRFEKRIRGEIIIILRFERRVCRWESCRMHQVAGMWLNPNSRGSRPRIWQPWGCKSRVADRRVVHME